MLRRFWQLTLLLFATWLLTGPLALLQLGAWSWMLVSYSQESSLEQAIRETFGDERPCDLCRMIDVAEERRASTSNEAPNTQLKDLKLMLGLARTTTVDAPQIEAMDYPERALRPSDRLGQVPTPPPRA